MTRASSDDLLESNSSSPDLGDDLPRRLLPAVDGWIGVVVGDVVLDGGDQRHDAREAAPAESFVGQLLEPPFHEVEQRGTGRYEVQVEPGVCCQSGPHVRMAVSAVVIKDQMDLEPLGHLAVDQAQEAKELLVAVVGHALKQQHPGQDVEGGEQRRGPWRL